VQVNGKVQVSVINHFWESTGFCPPLPHDKFTDFILSEDEYQNLLHIASTPNKGLEQVRIHWMLDLVNAQITSNGIKYDFLPLDLLIDLLHELGLKPGFELMGNPSNIFTDFENKTQIYAWRDLVYEIALRYINKYGLDYVSSWNFESWNEPDNGDFDGLKFTPSSFLNYYDACVEGLAMVKDGSLKIGAPGGKCLNGYSYCTALLQHCYNGTNYFTGEKGVRLDFLSFHNKGKATALSILELEEEQIQLITSLFPGLKHLPVYNDEGDPLGGWNKPEEWRADARYATMVAKGVALHQNVFFPQNPDINYQLISNDNGFMNFGPPNFFDQRTLTARFQMNLTQPRSVEFIRKPVLSVMGLLSLLGAHQIEAAVYKGSGEMNITGQVGVVASFLPAAFSVNNTWEVSILIYNSLDSSTETSDDVCSVQWKNFANFGEKAMFVHYQLDNTAGRNAYMMWVKAGRPNYPSSSLLSAMRSAADTLMVGSPMPLSASGSYNFSCPLPSVSLLHGCSDSVGGAPTKVGGVRVHVVTKGEYLVTWSSNPERCVQESRRLTCIQ
jgi:L-iduronidase